MTATTTPDVRSHAVAGAGRPALARLWWATPLAGVAAALANAIVYGVAEAAGALPDDVLVPGPTGREPIGLGAVVVGSAISAVGAALVLALIGRLSRRPVRTFRIVAAIALVVSFLTPLSVDGAPLSMVLTLELMHIVAAATIVGVLTPAR